MRLDNDANCFALSEAWDDEFRQYPLVMGLILGTGVGGGIIIDGKPITGRSYITGEFGHIRLPVDALEVVGRDFPLTRCGCGQHGCIENYLSGRGFAWLCLFTCTGNLITLSSSKPLTEYFWACKIGRAHV